MKRINIKTFTATALMTLFLVACSDILEEQPRSIYEPGFFKTEKGVYGGLTSMYAHLRYIYGQAYYYNACLTGTDEGVAFLFPPEPAGTRAAGLARGNVSPQAAELVSERHPPSTPAGVSPMG